MNNINNHKLKSSLKRIISGLLVTVLLASEGMSDVSSISSVYAEETEVTVYGQDNAGHEKQDLSQEGVTFDYGTNITLSLSNDASGITYNIKKTGSEDEIYSANTVYDPGTYYINYIDDDGNGYDSFDKYHFEIKSTELAKATGLTWTNGSTAQWNTVTTDVNGNGLSVGDNGVTAQYKLVVYKDNTEVATIQPSDISLADGDTQSYDLASTIEAQGEGVYTFAVVTEAPSTASKYYKESAESGKSSDSAVAVKINLKKENANVTSASVNGKTDTSFLLIAGNSNKNSKEISASVAANWDFDKWSVADAYKDYVTFTNASSTTTSLTLAATYDSSKGCSVDVTAESRENTAPTIVAGSFKVEGDKLVAKAYDNQSGIKAYAFSTETDGSNIAEADWTVLDTEDINDSDSAAQYTSGTIDASGSYYFYAKDADGNIARSTSSIAASVITLNDYYVSNSKKTGDDAKEVYLGNSTYNLPASSGVSRKGYTFAGWYADESHTGSVVTSLSTNPAADTAYYAKWTLDEITWSTALTAKTTTYTGKDQNYKVAVSVTSADVSYEWYKENASGTYDKLEETSDTLKLRDVNDSGTYKVTATFSYTDDDGNEQQYVLNGTPAELKIEPAALTITAVSKTIAYGDDIPDYTYTYSGLVGDDKNADGTLSPKGADSINVGTLTGNYTKGDVVGSYNITFDTEFTNQTGTSNYTITNTPGTLTVSQKNAAADMSGVTVTVNPDSYTYTGSAIEPTYTVKDGDTEITTDQYDVTYPNGNTTASDNHTLRVTFKDNYTGYVDATWKITKAEYSPEITIDSTWEYGENYTTPKTVAIKASSIPEFLTNYEVNYYYLTGNATTVDGTSGGTTTQPVNAGTYTVYAIIHDKNGNYDDQISSPVTFTITPRKIIFTAESQTWDYDGNSHSYETSDSDPGYVMTDSKGNVLASESDAFILSKEGFQSIQLSGSVKDVNLVNGVNEGQPNTVTATFTTATNSSNYTIEYVSGVLKVNPVALNSPANIQWDSSDSSKAGTASWVAISKKDLVVKYKVTLWSHDDSSNTDSEITSVTTSDTSYDFTSTIHSQISAGSKKSFYFTVQTLVDTSTDAAGIVKNDYKESAVSSASGKKYTATISLTKKLCDDSSEDQPGLSSISFHDASVGDSITLLAGESVSIDAIATNGYVFASSSSCSNGHEYHTIWHPTTPAYTGYFSISSWNNSISNGCYNYKATITLSASLDQALGTVDITASTCDDDPWFSGSVTAANADDYSGVNVSFTAADKIGLANWAIWECEEHTSTYTVDGKDQTTTYYTLKSCLHNENISGTSATCSYKISRPGIYTVRITDTAGNTDESNVFTIYEIKFDKGDTTDSDASHVMSPIYKLANTDITLPACTYTKTGYSFQNWKGTSTGTSTDRAVYKANMSDTLTAQWTNEQYSYTVNYYYMDADGSYPSEPSTTATYYGKYGDIISAVDTTDETLGAITATAAILKPKTNYDIDTNPGITGYKPYMKLTGSGQTLAIYYNTGTYKITYSYTLPGAATPTTTEISVRYGASITEPDKPDQTANGYDFVGWDYDGYGSAPTTMPAKNLTASGQFVAKDTTYKVVYHMETLGTGETHTEQYSVDDSLTQTLNATQGTTVTAYAASKGTTLTTNEVEGGDQDGFSLKGVYITNGAASGDTLPDSIISTSSTTATVEYNSSKTLYINYYYERNVYNLKLEVWKDSREDNSNLKYTSSVKKQYQENIAVLTARYQLDSYYIDTSTNVSVLEGFTMPSGYKFASYTDFSTGNAPTTMPAGDVTVTRDVVAADKAKYKIEVYFEKTAIDSYSLMTTLSYEAAAGSQVKIVKDETEKTSDTAENQAQYTYVYYDSFIDTILNSGYYQHIGSNLPEGVTGGGPVESGTVTDADTGTLTLKIYFERKSYNARIGYYYGNTTKTGSNAIATFTLSGKWGSKFTIDPIALFDADTDSEWYKSGVYAESGLTSVTCNSIVDSTGTHDALSYDFRNNSYLVSYRSHYYYFGTNDVVTWTWPSHTFTTVGNGTTYAVGSYFGGNTEPTAAGIGDKIEGYFGINNNTYFEVHYDQISTNDDFYLDLRLRQDNLYNNGSWIADKYGTTTYLDGYTYVPITYEYNGSKYQLRVINKCAVYDNVTSTGASGLANYPAANARTRTLNYESATLKTGFTRIGETNYYFYDGTVDGAKQGEDGTTAYSGGKYVYYAVDDSRFIQGAYTGISFDIEKTYEGQQAQAIISDYKANAADKKATAIYCTNASYGSTYIYGDYGYLTFTYGYQSDCQLYYYYNGNTCSNDSHKYVYGTTLTNEQITSPTTCKHGITVPDGYEMVWYLDSGFTQSVPADGLTVTQNRTLYGRMEKSTIPNKEYVYYELADPITIGDTTYNYITQDELTLMSNNGYTVTSSVSTETIDFDDGVHDTPVSKTINITRYTYDDSLVMIEIDRPTLAYSELYLAKDTSTYTSYYGTSGQSYEEAYGMEGFKYDETNTSNRSYGYVNTTALILKSYFARDKYQVEVDPANSTTSNTELKSFSIGQKVQLDTYTKNGYTFKEWTWQKYDSATSTYVDYEPTYVTGMTYFTMPAFNLKAQAVWTPAEFTQDVTHYFQGADQTYNNTFIASIESYTVDSTYTTASFNGTDYDCSVYKSGSDIKAVVVTDSTNNIIYYFSAGTVDSSKIKVAESDLVAATSQIKVTSEVATAPDKGSIGGLSMYSYDYTTLKTTGGVSRLNSDTTYAPVYGMTLEYYYKRSANCKVRLIGVSTDGQEAGITLGGDGDHTFGESVTLSASLADGYTFKGWYKPQDIFSNYDPTAEGYDADMLLSAYKLKENLDTVVAKATPVYTAASQTVTMSEGFDLVAVVAADIADEPTLSISGKTAYVYGYEASSSNALMAIAAKKTYTAEEYPDLTTEELAEKNRIASKTTITGYQWYTIAATLDADNNVVAVEGAEP